MPPGGKLGAKCPRPTLVDPRHQCSSDEEAQPKPKKARPPPALAKPSIRPMHQCSSDEEAQPKTKKARPPPALAKPLIHTRHMCSSDEEAQPKPKKPQARPAAAVAVKTVISELPKADTEKVAPQGAGYSSGEEEAKRIRLAIEKGKEAARKKSEQRQQSDARKLAAAKIRAAAKDESDDSSTDRPKRRALHSLSSARSDGIALGSMALAAARTTPAGNLSSVRMKVLNQRQQSKNGVPDPAKGPKQAAVASPADIFVAEFDKLIEVNTARKFGNRPLEFLWEGMFRKDPFKPVKPLHPEIKTFVDEGHNPLAGRGEVSRLLAQCQKCFTHPGGAFVRVGFLNPSSVWNATGTPKESIVPFVGGDPDDRAEFVFCFTVCRDTIVSLQDEDLHKRCPEDMRKYALNLDLRKHGLVDLEPKIVYSEKSKQQRLFSIGGINSIDMHPRIFNVPPSATFLPVMGAGANVEIPLGFVVCPEDLWSYLWRVLTSSFKISRNAVRSILWEIQEVFHEKHEEINRVFFPDDKYEQAEKYGSMCPHFFNLTPEFDISEEALKTLLVTSCNEVWDSAVSPGVGWEESDDSALKHMVEVTQIAGTQKLLLETIPRVMFLFYFHRHATEEEKAFALPLVYTCLEDRARVAKIGRVKLNGLRSGGRVSDDIFPRLQSYVDKYEKGMYVSPSTVKSGLSQANEDDDEDLDDGDYDHRSDDPDDETFQSDEESSSDSDGDSDAPLADRKKLLDDRKNACAKDFLQLTAHCDAKTLNQAFGGKTVVCASSTTRNDRKFNDYEVEVPVEDILRALGAHTEAPTRPKGAAMAASRTDTLKIDALAVMMSELEKATPEDETDSAKLIGLDTFFRVVPRDAFERLKSKLDQRAPNESLLEQRMHQSMRQVHTFFTTGVGIGCAAGLKDAEKAVETSALHTLRTYFFTKGVRKNTRKTDGDMRLVDDWLRVEEQVKRFERDEAQDPESHAALCKEIAITALVGALMNLIQDLMDEAEEDDQMELELCEDGQKEILISDLKARELDQRAAKETAFLEKLDENMSIQVRTDALDAFRAAQRAKDEKAVQSDLDAWMEAHQKKLSGEAETARKERSDMKKAMRAAAKTPEALDELWYLSESESESESESDDAAKEEEPDGENDNPGGEEGESEDDEEESEDEEDDEDGDEEGFIEDRHQNPLFDEYVHFCTALPTGVSSPKLIELFVKLAAYSEEDLFGSFTVVFFWFLAKRYLKKFPPPPVEPMET